MWQDGANTSLASKQKVGSERNERRVLGGKHLEVRPPRRMGSEQRSASEGKGFSPTSTLLENAILLHIFCQKILIFAVNFGRMFTIFKIVRTNFVLVGELKTCAADFNFEFLIEIFVLQNSLTTCCGAR